MLEKISHKVNLSPLLLEATSQDLKFIFSRSQTPLSSSRTCVTPAGKIIEPHVHNPVLREMRTQEVFFIRRGRLRGDFYDEECSYLTQVSKRITL